jgi:putative endonuclease
VARGWRAGRGELDLVAIDRQTVVFVEVKTRRDQRHGHPAEAVDERKQRQIVALSERYRKRHRLFDYPVRYDIVAITWSDDQQSPEVSHFKAAFPAPDGMD